MTTPIRVLYDDHGFRMKHGGVARYFCELFRHFSNVEPVLPFKETSCHYLQQSPWCMVPPKHDYDAIIRRWFFGYRVLGVWTAFMFLTRHFPHIFKSTDYENDQRFIQYAAKRNYDLIHLTEAHSYGTYWKSIPKNVPLVITVHDLIPELLLNRDDIRSGRKDILARATMIIAVSEFTKAKLIEQYEVPEDKIVVIHHGYTGQKEEQPIAQHENMAYLLYVGKRNGYKRFDFFFDAVAPVLKSYGDLHLICTGDPFTKEEIRLFQNAGLLGKVHSYFANDKKLHWLYSHAKMFIYPSQMEGFGLPVLEAFAAGCPVLLSNSSCFPEVAGDAALYFNPDNSDDLREKIVMILDNERLAGTLRLKGKERLALFSWEKCAKETERVYLKAIETLK